MLAFRRSILIVATLLVVAGAQADEPSYGPAKGTLIIVGGGSTKGTGILEKFIALAGGKDAKFVIVPTAGGNKTPDGAPRVYDEAKVVAPWKRLGLSNVRMLHTHDPKVADTEAFVAPLREANAVWFDGGRQWHIVDSYKNTLAEREFHKVLERGGVVAGSSAGATIQGDYLVRGAIAGPDIMMTPEKEHERGFAFLRKSAIDQHIDTRNRWDDLISVIRKYPDHLGIGLSEGTAIVVQGDRFEVMGPGKVAIHDSKRKHEPWEKPYFVLEAGDRFDMKTRTATPGSATIAARIAKLETELDSLRGLARTQTTLTGGIFLPKTLRITVLPGDWGGDVDNVAVVCRSAASEMAHFIPERDPDPITVKYRAKGPPMVVFGKGDAGERRVLIDSRDRAWSQLAFQFAHEFCHIQCNYRDANTANLWFEESLCETASLFALKRMATTWKTKPPYGNWKSYAASLGDYAEERIKATESRDGLTLAKWFARHEAALRANATDRGKNQVVAVAVLPLLEKGPEHWAAIRYLNRWEPKQRELTFAEYLRDWHDRVPAEHKTFVADVAGLFEIALPK
jgi:cyanophycinase